MMEDHLAPYTPDLGPLRLQRTGLERSFEDLIRLHYVAFSRAEAALLLVGTNAMLKGKTPVRSVATWHRMDETWPWRPEQGRPPSIVTPADIAMI
jgi:DNA helicase-2/ATP-dependent DNA helicase PcrA